MAGDWAPISSGQTFLGLTQTLSYTPAAGDYKLVIEQPTLPALKEAGSKKLCYPFLFVYQLEGETASVRLLSISLTVTRIPNPNVTLTLN